MARFVRTLGAFSMPFLAALLVHDHGAPIYLAGAVVGAFGLATIPSRLLGGLLTTRVGTKPAVLIGVAGTAAAQLLIALAPDLMVALVGAVLLGLCFEIYEPASQGRIADVTPPESQPRAYGLLGAALAAAGLCAGLVAAAVGRAGLPWLFAADAVAAIICFAVIAAWLPATPRPAQIHAGATIASPWKDRRLLLLMATGTTFATVYMLVPMAMPLALTAAGRPASDAGLLQALSALLIVCGQPALRRTTSIGARLATGYALLALGLTIAGLQMTMTGYVIATIVMAIGDALLLGYSYAVVASIAPEGGKAPYFAAYGVTWGIALTVGPPAMGQLLGNGYATFWFVCAMLMLGTGIGQLAINRSLRQKSLGHVSEIH
ncbi:MFS transporter [Microbacterium sp. 13-71-7]|uniref:MFS transporter n=1 Tax=Microbacterium sp. 13-71-7 TaxID=1970399 RepID=UPI0025D045B3|nr:MFS transporter [Microbacterium sp. 13-71-7]